MAMAPAPAAGKRRGSSSNGGDRASTVGSLRRGSSSAAAVAPEPEGEGEGEADGGGAGGDRDMDILDAGASAALTASLVRGGVKASGGGIELAAGSGGRGGRRGDDGDAAALFARPLRKDGSSEEGDAASSSEGPAAGKGSIGLHRSALSAALASRAGSGLRSSAAAAPAAGLRGAPSASRPASSPFALSSAAFLSAQAPQKAVRIDSALSTIDAYLSAHGRGAAGARGVAGRSGSAGAAAAGTGRGPQLASKEETGGSDSLGGVVAGHSLSDPAVECLEDGASDATVDEPMPAPAPLLLTSVRELLLGVRSARHEGLDLLLKRHVLVGVLSESLSLVQVRGRAGQPTLPCVFIETCIAPLSAARHEAAARQPRAAGA